MERFEHQDILVQRSELMDDIATIVHAHYPENTELTRQLCNAVCRHYPNGALTR